MNTLRKLGIVLLAELTLILPLSTTVLAAPSPSPSTSPADQCTQSTDFTGVSNAADLLNDKTIAPPPEETVPDEGAPTATESPQAMAPSSDTRTLADVPPIQPDPGDGADVPYQSISLDDLKQNPFFSQADFDAFVQSNHGWFDATTNRWDFCSFNGMDNINSLIPVYQGLSNYLNVLDSPYDKLVFENPLDRYALTGEPCTLFDPRTNVCDETKQKVAVTDINGNPILDASGNPLMEDQPKYYDDSIWPNGQWDAPKADLRILKTLVYLVTPTDLGGAGREHIKVAEIIQPTAKSKESLVGSTSTNTAAALATPGPSSSSTSTPTASPTATPSSTPEPTAQDSAHQYDTEHPSNPTQIASALDISEIDNVRITTKIVQERRLGGNTTTYQYKSVPLQVAWQTDQGVQTADLVGPNMYQAALSSFSTGLAGLLDSMDLSATLDLSSIKDVNSLGDVAVLIGQSLLGQLLNSPTGSLSGWDLGSVLESVGRAYLAEQLGLPSNALSSGTTADELVQTVGRTTVEKSFGLPADSLVGKTSADIFASLGRRQLETTLGVSEGTLLPYGQITQSQLLERIGAGKIEQRFLLPQGSMQVGSWSKAINTVKTKFLFTKSNAAFVDEALSMAFQPVDNQNVDSFNFTAADFAAPTSDFLNNPSDASFASYKRLVGARAIEAGIGKFTSATSTFSGADSSPQTQNFVKAIADSYGFHFYTLGQSVGLNQTTLYHGAPAGSLSIYTITIDNTSPVLTSGVYTLDELKSLALQDLSANLQNTFGNACVDPNNPCYGKSSFKDSTEATTLYNLIQTNWIPLLQTQYDRAQEAQRQAEQSRATGVPTTGINEAAQIISAALGQTRSYADGILTMLNANGQSGRSAALGLPGNFLGTNPDGTLTGTSLNTGDPITNFLNGNLTSDLMTLIGKAYAAQAMTQDKPAQNTLVSQVKTDLKSFDTLTKYGIDVNTWISKGFSGDDFDRIFTKDLGSEVFTRIGQQQLLGTLWGKTDFNNVIQNALGSNQANTVLNQVAQAAQGVAFYVDRFKQLQTLTTLILQQSQSLTGLTPDIQTTLQSLNGLTNLDSIGAVRDSARQYEPLLQVLGTSASTIKDEIVRAQGILREIAAGQPLNFSQSASGNPTPQKGISNDGCFSSVNLRSFFGTGSNLVTTLATQVAGCRVDDALGLPLGSAYAWYQSKDYSLDSLSLAIGQNYAKAHGNTLTDDAARAYGQQLLEGAALNKLVGGIPGISGLVKKLGFKGSDIVDLLNGRGELTLEKMGGSMMDSYFNWKAGTGQNLLLPTCNDSNSKPTPCTREQETSIRLDTLAKVGLQKLGITLNFPSTLDLFPSTSSALGKFDFLTNFGISRISETFGLKANTFYGSFADVRGRNAPQALLQGIGWYDTPATRNLSALAQAILPTTAGLSASQASAINELVTQAQQSADDIRNVTLNMLTDPSSAIWVDGQEGAVASSMFADEQGRYGVAISNLNELLATASLDPLTNQKVQNAISSYASPNLGSADIYKALITAFKTRITGLDGQYGVAAGTFKAFITGTGTAEDIAQHDAQRELVNTFADKTISSLLAGTPFADLPDTFKALSTDPACPGGASLGDFLMNISGKTASACTIKSISLSQIFNGKDIGDQSKRAFLYDNFLARAFGQQLEKDLKLEPGTIRAIAIQPWRAKEVAIDQGIRLLGAQLFKLTGADSLSTDSSKQLIRALDGSLLAGFCPVDPLSIQGDIEKELVGSTDKLCTLHFNSLRSMIVLRQDINQLLQQRFNQNGLDSSKISLVDLAPVFIGGLSGAYFLGAATLARTLNDQLGVGTKAQSFKIQYNDIRNAFGQFTLTPADYKIFEQNAQADFVRSYYDCYNPENISTDPTCSLSNSDLIATYLNDSSDTSFSQADRLDTLNQLASSADVSAPSQLKQRALNNLQYSLYDIIAFKTDPSIPKGFAYAMLQGSGQQKLVALEGYLANKLNLGASVFGGLLTNDMVVNLTTYIEGGFKGSVNLDAVNALDHWLGQESNKLFGVTLPAGTIQGIFAWGTTGFKGSAFDSSSKFDVGGKQFSSVGTVLKNWGVTRLLSWADMDFGWQAGSAYQIYQAANDVIKASAYLKFIQTPLGLGASAGSGLSSGATQLGKAVAGDPSAGAAVHSEADARANLKAAQAALVATVINIVFASQIGEAEQGLGLVPGTGALGVTMLVQLAMGVPVDPITLGLFIGLNLIGVYATQISVRATVDGYYPYTGKYGAARVKPEEYISPDPQTETFDAMNPVSYRAGLEHGARYKVNQTLQDLLLMPTRWAAATGEDPNNLFVEQVFTDRPEDVASLDGLISAPAPWDTPSGWGYGPLKDRATIQCGQTAGVVTTTTSACTATANDGYRAGYFADDAFATHIHIRF